MIGRVPLRALCVHGFLVLLVVALAACDTRPTNPPLGPRPTASPNPGPGVAGDGETPAHAARRLFRQTFRDRPSYPASLAIVGSSPGPPVPVSQDYPDAPLTQWVLPNDATAVKGNMFGAMWPTAMKQESFLVPMVKDGRVVGEFSVTLGDDGRWEAGAPELGSLFYSEQRTSLLEQKLGPGTEVRIVVFLPSGFAFAVGDNRGREAAVFLGEQDYGPGITHESPKHLGVGEGPKLGELLSQDQLVELYGQSE